MTCKCGANKTKAGTMGHGQQNVAGVQQFPGHSHHEMMANHQFSQGHGPGQYEMQQYFMPQMNHHPGMQPGHQPDYHHVHQQHGGAGMHPQQHGGVPYGYGGMPAGQQMMHGGAPMHQATFPMHGGGPGGALPYPGHQQYGVPGGYGGGQPGGQYAMPGSHHTHQHSHYGGMPDQHQSFGPGMTESPMQFNGYMPADDDDF
ncbi:hypothetical protein [Evansella clarkii]|uniref:hypothetical protein n=1 Tax=Evansella clarkii TaxID=79879 RepID=UPI000B448137|nr:hypothetical protein [Evansella clarkii]